ncbi:signal peptidase I [Longimicrobium sp.]|uniref:signal peptidase I n=1 Tax=Longimicrobium sp. TaxID=2029185 RepID=UPI002ED7E8E1
MKRLFRTAARQPADTRRYGRGWVRATVATFGAVVLARTFAVQVYGISSPSMRNTLHPGDYVITSGLPFGTAIPGTRWSTPRFRDPRRGEVVVYGEKPGDPPARIIKRVIGGPGDTVRMVDGRVIRNGRTLDEPYASPILLDDEPLAFDGPYGVAWHLAALPAGVSATGYRPTRDRWGPLVIPPGHYLLLGDDRDGSRDSRYTGFIAREQIRGKVYRIYYSVAPQKNRFPRALTAARWSRIGDRVD